MSDLAKGASQTLICTPQILRENTIVDNNTDEKKVGVLIRQVEDDYIRDIIGPSLYFTLLDKINNNVLSGSYLTLVNNYVIPTVFKWFKHDWLLESSYQMKAKGVGQQTGPNYQAASMSDIKDLKEFYLSKAQQTSNVMIRYLTAYQDQFPEYRQFITLEDTPPANSVTSSNIVLPPRGPRGNWGCCGTDDAGNWKNRFSNDTPWT